MSLSPNSGHDAYCTKDTTCVHVRSGPANSGQLPLLALMIEIVSQILDLARILHQLVSPFIGFCPSTVSSSGHGVESDLSAARENMGVLCHVGAGLLQPVHLNTCRIILKLWRSFTAGHLGVSFFGTPRFWVGFEGKARGSQPTKFWSTLTLKNPSGNLGILPPWRLQSPTCAGNKTARNHSQA